MFIGLLKLAIFGIIFGICGFYIRVYLKGNLCDLKNRIDGKDVLITGSNTGIGYELAKELLKRGGRIHLACRNLIKCQNTRKQIIDETDKKFENNLLIYELDLANLKSIYDFSQLFLRSNSKLDILVNNAGVMMTPYLKTKNDFELQIGTNHLGHFYLTNLLLDIIKSTKESRIVIVSSIGHEMGSINTTNINMIENEYNSIKAYCQSKLANVLHGKILAKKLKQYNIPVVSLHPGSVATELQREWPQWIIKIYQFFQIIYVKTPYEGMQTSLCCCLKDDLMKYSGEYFADLQPTKSWNSEVYNDTLAEWLWNHSEELIANKLQQLN